MAAKEPFEIPVGMRRVCRRFERWRQPVPPAGRTTLSVSQLWASLADRE